VAFERINDRLYQAAVYADQNGEVIGSRNAWAVSDRRTEATATRWYLALYNDSTATFVDVFDAGICYATTVDSGISRSAVFFAYRISVKRGGTNATPVAFNTASPALPPRIKAARMLTAATVIGAPLGYVSFGNRTGGSGSVRVQRPQPLGALHFFQYPLEEPIVLRGQEGIAIQQWTNTSGFQGTMNTYFHFRVRS
jgi:hypothetical protein